MFISQHQVLKTAFKLCSGLLFCCCEKGILSTSSLVRKSFISVYTSKSQLITERSRSRNLNGGQLTALHAVLPLTREQIHSQRGTEGTMEKWWLLSLPLCLSVCLSLSHSLTCSCLASFLMIPGPPTQGMALITVGWALLHVLTINPSPHKHAHRSSVETSPLL